MAYCNFFAYFSCNVGKHVQCILIENSIKQRFQLLSDYSHPTQLGCVFMGCVFMGCMSFASLSKTHLENSSMSILKPDDEVMDICPAGVLLSWRPAQLVWPYMYMHVKLIQQRSGPMQSIVVLPSPGIFLNSMTLHAPPAEKLLTLHFTFNHGCSIQVYR